MLGLTVLVWGTNLLSVGEWIVFLFFAHSPPSDLPYQPRPFIGVIIQKSVKQCWERVNANKLIRIITRVLSDYVTASSVETPPSEL